MLKIDDPIELSELHRAILEAKFHPFPTDAAAAGSPVLAGVSNRIYDELSRKQDKRSADIAAFQDLRRIKSQNGYRGQWRTAVMAARRDTVMRDAGYEDRIAFAKCYLSPFSCTDDELREFLDDVDGKTGEHDIGKLFTKNRFASAQMLDLAYSFGRKQAHLVFILKDMRVCDIYFSGVHRFETVSEGEPPEIAVLKKFNASAGKTQKLEAVLEGGGSRLTLSVEADSADYWL